MIKNLLIKVFKFSCILSTIIMVGFWIYKYQLNEDSTTIEYKLVNEINDIVHPEFSIGILEPFLNDELQKKLNVSSDDTLDDQYKEFLRGNETYFEKFKDVEYEKVTPNLFKYLEKIDFFWKTGSSHTQLSCTDMQNCSLVKLRNNYNGFIEWHFMKAYGLQINPTNAKDVTQIEFSFNSDLENVISQVEGVFVTFNYPNQYLRSLEGSTLIWNHSGNESNQDIFEVTSFEILRRRNKKMEPCLSQWKLYDELILESHMKKMMCRAPYQKPCNNLKPCNTAFDIKRSIYNGFFDRGKAFDRPCQEMPTITYKHLFHYKPIPENQTKKFRFFLQYPRRGKVITQSKAIDGQTLIGNIGGYIGLLLGMYLGYFNLYNQPKIIIKHSFDY